MDFINSAAAQASDLFRSMTVGARITAGLLLAVVIVSLAYLFNYQVNGGETYLLGGQHFSTSELTAMQAAFSEAGLGGFEVHGGQILIPRAQQAAYIAALAEAKALPMNWNDHLVRALDSSNPFTTSRERDERMHVARQQELSMVLKSMKDVENATVHYDSQKKTGFGQERNSTASVMIQLVGGRTLDEERVEMIREMVAACFADLAPDKVTISDLGGHRVYGPPGKDGIGAGNRHQYISAKVAYEKQYERNIYDALAFVPGVVVAVNVELEKDLTRSLHSTKHDPKTVPVDVREEQTTTKSETAAPRGAPGLDAQQPRPNQSVRISDVAKGSTSEEERSSREERNMVSSETETVQQIGLTPRRTTVTVSVPSTYFEEIWRRQNPTPEGQMPKAPDATALANIETEEMAKIRNHVVPLIPKPTDVLDPTPLVTVSKFEALPTAELPVPTTAEATLAWLGNNWSTAGMSGLVLVSLLMMRSMIRSNVGSTRPIDFGLPERTAEAESKAAPAEAASEPPKNRLKRAQSSGGSLKDDLTDLVREDPDAAANILRSWIGNAG
jgi:flagellar M-ring protein FliF